MVAALTHAIGNIKYFHKHLKRTFPELLWRNEDHSRYSSSASTGIERLGEHPYGSRQYRVVDKSQQTVIASIHAHRNIIFGAKIHQQGHSLVESCRTILSEAVHDAGSNGEQPQSIAAMNGLCEWVIRQGLERPESTNKTIQSLTDFQLEAVRAIATGVPRAGHSVVGPGTHRDAGDAWESLARDYIQCKTEADDDECVLYQANGGQLVAIELLADTKPEYLISAGGAMARFFLL
jgi:hypothetical protein